MMKRLMIAAGLATALAAPAFPVFAQSNDKLLVVYGNDPCPAGTICVRKGDSERYRIPKELRDNMPAAHNERWADRAKSLESVGAAGTGSCTSTGAGGWTGCWAKQMREARAERQARKEEGATPND